MNKETLNTFSEGIITDLNPITTPNNVLTFCLNGTTVTYNGNEFVLQNDMGNGKVDEAFLPEGFIPVGMQEHGGIVYIASYNPISQLSQIGSFPSPEQTKSSELKQETPTVINKGLFVNTLDKKVTNINQRFVLSNQLIFSGDEFGINIEQIGDIKVPIDKHFTLQLGVLDQNNKMTFITDNLKTTDGKWWTAQVGAENKVIVDQLYKGTKGKLILILKLNILEEYNCEVVCDKELDDSYTLKFSPTSDPTKLKGHKLEINNQSALVNLNNPLVTIEKENGDSPFINYKISPITNYGILDSVNIDGVINLNLVNSGSMNVLSWRYFYDNLNRVMNLNWELEYYPKKGEFIDSVKLFLYDLTELNPTPINIPLSYEPKFGGTFNESFKLLDYLREGFPYLCHIEVKLNDGTIHKFVKFMIASDVYNQHYYNTPDFCKKELGVSVKTKATSTSKLEYDSVFSLKYNGKNDMDIPVSYGKNPDVTFRTLIDKKDSYKINKSVVLETNIKDVEVNNVPDEVIDHRFTSTNTLSDSDWLLTEGATIENLTSSSEILGDSLIVSHQSVIKANSKKQSINKVGTIFKPYLDDSTEFDIFGQYGITSKTGYDTMRLTWQYDSDRTGDNNSNYFLRTAELAYPYDNQRSYLHRQKQGSFNVNNFWEVRELYKQANQGKEPDVLFQTSWLGVRGSNLLNYNTDNYSFLWIKDNNDNYVGVTGNSFFKRGGSTPKENAALSMGVLFRSLYIAKDGQFLVEAFTPNLISYLRNYKLKVLVKDELLVKQGASLSYKFKGSDVVINSQIILDNAKRLYTNITNNSNFEGISNITYTLNTKPEIKNLDIPIDVKPISLEKEISIYNNPEMIFNSQVIEFVNPNTGVKTLINAEEFDRTKIYYPSDENGHFVPITSYNAVTLSAWINGTKYTIKAIPAFVLFGGKIYIDPARLTYSQDLKIGSSDEGSGDRLMYTKFHYKKLFFTP